MKSDNQKGIADAGGIVPLVALAGNGSAEQTKNAAGALRHLALNADNRVAIILVCLLLGGGGRRPPGERSELRRRPIELS